MHSVKNFIISLAYVTVYDSKSSLILVRCNEDNYFEGHSHMKYALHVSYSYV